MRLTWCKNFAARSHCKLMPWPTHQSWNLKSWAGKNFVPQTNWERERERDGENEIIWAVSVSISKIFPRETSLVETKVVTSPGRATHYCWAMTGSSVCPAEPRAGLVSPLLWWLLVQAGWEDPDIWDCESGEARYKPWHWDQSDSRNPT